METINYSSTYEVINTNEGVGHTYSAQEQTSSNIAKTTADNEEHYYHVLESGGHECVPEGGRDHEVPTSQTHSQVWLSEEEYSTLKH